MDAMAAPPDESFRAATPRRPIRNSSPPPKLSSAIPTTISSPNTPNGSIDKKKAAENAGGTAYWDSILDKLNIETCLANRVACWRPISIPKRFHWVFFVDSFLFPFDNHDQTAKNADMGVYIPLQEKVLSSVT